MPHQQAAVFRISITLYSTLLDSPAPRLLNSKPAGTIRRAVAQSEEVEDSGNVLCGRGEETERGVAVSGDVCLKIHSRGKVPKALTVQLVHRQGPSPDALDNLRRRKRQEASVGFLQARFLPHYLVEPRVAAVERRQADNLLHSLCMHRAPPHVKDERVEKVVQLDVPAASAVVQANVIPAPRLSAHFC